MPDHDRIATLIQGVIDLVVMDLPSHIVASHVALVLSGWADAAARSPDLHAQFIEVRDALAQGLDTARLATLAELETATGNQARVLGLRAATLEAGRNAARLATAS